MSSALTLEHRRGLCRCRAGCEGHAVLGGMRTAEVAAWAFFCGWVEVCITHMLDRRQASPDKLIAQAGACGPVQPTAAQGGAGMPAARGQQTHPKNRSFLSDHTPAQRG